VPISCGSAPRGSSETLLEVPRRASFPGGIFVTGVEMTADGVAIGVFASRAVPLDDLRARLTLGDSAGTQYEHATVAPGVIDGPGRLLFKPAPPPHATWLTLKEPGASVTWLLENGSP
jgi:hypothetical protein